jgi:ABC-type sugar transport system permease subunit
VSSVVKASGSKLSQRRKSDIKWGYFFILPQLFGVIAFVLFPLI